MKARIVENLGESQYRVELLRDESKQTQIIGAQQAIVNRLTNDDIPEAQTSVDDAQAVFDAASSAYDAAVSAYIAETKLSDGDTAATKAAIDSALDALASSRESLRLATLTLDILRADLVAARNVLANLKSSAQPQIMTCWTSQYDDSLTVDSEHEVVLIPGEPTSCVIHSAGITNDRLTPVLWQSPAQALFNYMVLPGWQKHQYRFGTATVLSDPAGGAVPIQVDPQPSSAQRLDTGRDLPSALAMNPEGYYQAEERVLIDYSDAEPVIVGYYVEPLIKWVARYAGGSFMEFTAPASVIASVLAEWPNIVCEWRQYPFQAYSPLTDIEYYGDNDPGSKGITWYDSSPFSFAYPSVTLQEYDLESYIRVDVDKYADSRDYGTHSYRIRSTITGKVYAEMTILVDSRLYSRVRAKTSNPIPQTLWQNSLPIYPLVTE